MKLENFRATEGDILVRDKHRIQRVVLRMWYDVVDGVALIPSKFTEEERTADDWRYEYPQSEARDED